MARVEAGWLGGTAISVDHLLAGIVLQDQNDVAGVRLRVGGKRQAVLSRPTMGIAALFFSADLAAQVLASVEGVSRRPVVPTDEDMLLSDDLKLVLNAADRIAHELHQSQIKPLHLLAAALDDVSSKGAELLRMRGITREIIIGKLRGN